MSTAVATLPAARRVAAADRPFLPAALEVIDTPPSPLPRAAALGVGLFFVAALAWAWLGQVEVVTTATGRVVPSGRVKVVQPLEGAAVAAIHVRNGDRVAAGDLLVELDATDVEAERAQAARELMVARVELAGWRALRDAPEAPLTAFAPPAQAEAGMLATTSELIAAQAAQQAARLAALDSRLAELAQARESAAANVARLEAILPLVEKQADARLTLVERQAAAALTALDAERQLIEYRQGLLVAREGLEQAEAAIATARQQKAEAEASFRATTLAEFSRAERRVAVFEQEMLKLDERLARRTLRAPVAGTVQQLAVTTVGGVVTPAQALLAVVPSGDVLEVEAVVENKDIGFIAVGQVAEVKLETFPFTRYGSLWGRVTDVSADAVADERRGLVYTARVALDGTTLRVDGRDVEVAPGMAATVEVQTGERRILDFLLDPVTRRGQESLRER